MIQENKTAKIFGTVSVVIGLLSFISLFLAIFDNMFLIGFFSGLFITMIPLSIAGYFSTIQKDTLLFIESVEQKMKGVKSLIILQNIL